MLSAEEKLPDLFDSTNQEFLRDPYPFYSVIRARDPVYIHSAVDEFLRFDSSVQIVRRVVSKDIELHGKQIKKGQVLTLLLGAANRDPDQFADPHKLDITRQNNKHLSFGAGIHHCLGFALAHLEAEIAIDTLIKRFPDIRLASDKFQYKQSPALRGLQALKVRL